MRVTSCAQVVLIVALVTASALAKSDEQVRYQIAGKQPLDVIHLLAQESANNIQIDKTFMGVHKGVNGDGSMSVEKAAKRKATNAESSGDIPEILIEGSRTLNADIKRSRDDVQPYVVLNREDIERSSAVNLEDLLRSKITMSSNEGSSAQSASHGGTSSISLRGLGSEQTLILVDGRRVAGTILGGVPQQPDLNGIPLSAIERIEVLPATASGIYGGGATGGVINVVLRRDYSGFDVKVGYGNAFHSDVASRTVSVSSGFGLGDGGTNVLMFGSYSDVNPLLVQEREFVQRGRAKIEFENPSYFKDLSAPPLGRTTNIRSRSGENLRLKDGTSLESPITYIPDGYGGVQTDGGAALVQNAGRYNLELAETAQYDAARSSLLAHPTVISAGLTVQQRINDSTRAFLDVWASNSESHFGINELSATFVIPSSAPNNPFEQDISVNTPAFGGDGAIVSENRQVKIVGGVLKELPRGWDLGFDYTWNRTRTASLRPPRSISENGKALVTSGEIDVLRDTNVFPISFEPYLGGSIVRPPAYTTLQGVVLRLAGPLKLSLPGGEPKISILGEHRHESFGDTYTLTGPSIDRIFPSRSQSVSSIYLETIIPLVSLENRIPGINLLELQIASRRDYYRTVGANSISSSSDQVIRQSKEQMSTDPTVGFRYKPFDDVMLRGSFGTGYLPPSVHQLVPFPPSTLPASLLNLKDPRRGNQPVTGNLTITSGGNPNLEAEQSKSWSAGFVVTPSLMPKLRFSVDWIKIVKQNNISTVGRLNQSIFVDEQYVPSIVQRGPVAPGDEFSAGPVIGLNLGLFNIARAEVEAFDFSVDYALESKHLGEFEFQFSGTKTLHSVTQLTPGSASVENLGIVNQGGGLRWKLRGELLWQRKNWTVAWTSNYYDSYWLNRDREIDPNQGSATIPSQIYHDFFCSYAVLDADSAVLRGVTFELGIKNVFDTSPPVDVGTNGQGSYSQWGDPRLAAYYFSVRKQLF